MEEEKEEGSQGGDGERRRDDEPVLHVRFDFYSSHNILRMFQCYLDYREQPEKLFSPLAEPSFLYDHYRPPDTVQRCANASAILHT